MDDFGTAPYWLPSNSDRTAGLTYWRTTKSSDTLEMHGVCEIGLRCLLRSTAGFCLIKGDTSASFHTLGSGCSLNDEFKMLVIGITRNSAYSLRIQFGMLSGPHALAGFSWRSALYTLASDS